MLKMSRRVALVATLIFAIVQTGYGLRCYDCTEMKSERTQQIQRVVVENSYCKDPFTDKAPIMECPRTNTVCLKYKSPAVAGATPKVVRTCGIANACHDLQKIIKGECVMCKHDLCNAAEIKFRSLFSVILFITAYCLT